MNEMVRGSITIIAIISLFLSATPVWAEGGHAGTKLMRGVSNILTGWVEIPKNMIDVSRDENILVGMTVGLGKGLGKGVLRTGAGVYDGVTFPFPMPEHYEPILEPAYVLGE